MCGITCCAPCVVERTLSLMDSTGKKGLAQLVADVHGLRQVPLQVRALLCVQRREETCSRAVVKVPPETAAVCRRNLKPVCDFEACLFL